MWPADRLVRRRAKFRYGRHSGPPPPLPPPPRGVEPPVPVANTFPSSHTLPLCRDSRALHCRCDAGEHSSLGFVCCRCASGTVRTTVQRAASICRMLALRCTMPAPRRITYHTQPSCAGARLHCDLDCAAGHLLKHLRLLCALLPLPHPRVDCSTSAAAARTCRPPPPPSAS